ncbi:ATP-binding protein [Streptomyces sp. NPDC054796]
MSGTRSDLSGSSRDVVQAGQVSGGVHFHAPAPAPADGDEPKRDRPPRPRQLPGDVRNFVNRTQELRRLNEAFSGEGEPFVAPVCVIVGTAGAGKTSLALRWAHQIRDHFPDGHLYVNLRGYDPGEPVTAEELLPRFLSALGVAPAEVPADPADASALYRSLLADRRMLIFLDNAATVAQVRPLLPGTARCLTVVTSRGRLSGLAVRDGAYRLTLGTLDEEEAVVLLRAVTSGYRPVPDDVDKLVELSRLCARLPLALRIAAERAAGHPHMRLDDLIADLRDESALWDALSTGDEEEAEAVRAVFTWSYRALSPDAARLFRLLGLHPGPEFGIGAVAALAGVRERGARQLLDVLAGAHLLEQTAPDRFAFHDLLRAYAGECAQGEEAAEERSAALRRLLDWYVRTADAAQSWIRPAEAHLDLGEPEAQVSPAAFTDYDQAVDWAEREHPNFLPLARAAERAGLDRYAWQLAVVLWNAKAPSSLTTDWLPMGRIGLAAARRLGDRPAQALLLEDLGFAHTKLNRLAEALDCHGDALLIRRDTGDREGEAASLNALGLVHLRGRELAPAAERLEQAAALFTELGEGHWQTVAVANLALVHFRAGRLAEADEAIHRALTVHRDEGAARSVGNALWILSGIHLDRVEPRQALDAAEEAVALALDLRSNVMEACWLLALGDAQEALGRSGDALVSYHRSASLHRRLGDHSREALAWQGAGATYHRIGRVTESVAFHRRAVAAHRALGDAWNEAAALDGLARALEIQDPGQARRSWAEALRLLGRYDDPRTVRMRAEIDHRLATVPDPEPDPAPDPGSGD